MEAPELKDASPADQAPPDSPAPTARTSKWVTRLTVFGPGIVVMLADTDAGSVVTAAQSGAQWGYQLLIWQIILMPILYIAQELTVRLGLVTQRGHGELIREQFGKGWAWLSVSTLLVACAGAIITEFSAAAGVGAIYGVPPWLSVGLVALFLGGLVLTGSYRRVERVAIALGALELIFFIVMIDAQPDLGSMAAAQLNQPIGNPDYLYLIAANIGAVIMPWMVFYQQSAVVDKGLTVAHLKDARVDTGFGAVLTQLVMAAVLVSVAATIGRNDPNATINTIEDITQALTPLLGETAGQILFSLGFLGAAFVAAIVVSLTAAWGLGEVLDYPRSLSGKPKEAPAFYAVYIAMLVIGFAFVLSGLNLVDLSVGIMVLNALLLPVVLGFLFALAVKVLPEEHKLKGWYRIVVAVVLVFTAGLGVYGGISGLLAGSAG
ncbi:NRAMP family divalent metal transporter [Mycobacterium sp. MS1601]|uniref:NRAMP family divalent metal transporter n=1 Tax=Mycobacterium sp. MS1601 TaxID=1936029 RepID=UPI0009FA80E2|nr:divalent metal cation transporter [Mycobacterium sp. MS1601]